MTSIAIQLHELFNKQPRLSFPFDDNAIPKNGIYVIFEKGEKVGELDRIVRIGTHNGDNNLLRRLKDHYTKQDKNFSVFRKHVGRCILNKENSEYLPIWNLDKTYTDGKAEKLAQIDGDYEKELENRISDYIQSSHSFCVFEVATEQERKFWEAKIVATLAQSGIKSSNEWFGNHSPDTKIKNSGLWQVQQLNGAILTDDEFNDLAKLVTQ